MVDVIEAVGAVPVSASPAVEGVLETASTSGSACSAGAGAFAAAGPDDGGIDGGMSAVPATAPTTACPTGSEGSDGVGAAWVATGRGEGSSGRSGSWAGRPTGNVPTRGSSGAATGSSETSSISWMIPSSASSAVSATRPA